MAVSTVMQQRIGIRHKFWVLFALQIAAISFATVLGVYGAASVLENVLIKQALKQESAHFMQRLRIDPQADLPDTYNMRAYLLTPGATQRTLPAEVRGLPIGYQQINQNGSRDAVYGMDTPRGRLYLVIRQDQIHRLVLLFGLIPLAVVLLIIYIASFLTWRASRRALSPVIALASVVRRWDPNRPDAASLAPRHLPIDVDGDVEALAQALHTFATRLDAFVERERNFTRDASHELRTPLTMIKVAADVLADDESLSPFAQRSLARIQRSVREMETLIEAFLMLARESDTGLPIEDFLVNDVVGEEVARYRDLLGGKPVEMKLRENARFALHAPPRVFAVVIGNLIRNACLYTEDGSIVIDIDSDSVRVVDTGCGMGEEDLERAFQPFYRGSRSGSEGHGIGLAIVRRIADRFDWPIEIDSVPGRGTIATVRFPAAMPVDQALPQTG